MGTVTQLDPPIPVRTPKGSGYAHFLIDYGQEHHLYWVVAQDETCEFWTWENPKVRIQLNHTMERTKATEPEEIKSIVQSGPVKDFILRQSYNTYQVGKP